MATPFLGMDPYLEHPILWTGVHSGLINAIRGQIAPGLRPRYVASVEERVMIDIPKMQRIPDLWIQKARRLGRTLSGSTTAVADVELEEPLVMEISSEPVREHYIEILDRYQDLKVVTVIEVLSPINKTPGPGRDEYLRKRNATLQSSTHLVEIDLLRRGTRMIDFSPEQLEAIDPFEYLVNVNRFESGRTQYEIIARQLRNRLPKFGIPLVHPDPDVALDLQAALNQVYEDGSYMLRIHYERPCSPALNAEDQNWAGDCWLSYRQAHSELFGNAAE
ncbi:MAG: DUF4058 family protein [Planctomycetales bacterium]|nr:DUF4058 family protein [Planctomycetales bacterium]